MKRAYLETNAISRAVEESLSGKVLRDILCAHGFVPVVGFHTIYELAKTFLNNEKIEVARALFQIVSDLEAEYCEESYEILCQELNSCLHQQHVKPFLAGGKQSDTLAEVAKLAQGIFDERARSFIENREKCFRADHPAISKNNIRAFSDHPPNSRVRTFDEFIGFYRTGQTEVVQQLFRNGLTLPQAEAVVASTERYPAIRAAIMANMYLFFVQMTQKVVPATDKVDDHRHVIEASYCDAFITNDNQLLNNLGKISPRLEAISWRALRPEC